MKATKIDREAGETMSEKVRNRYLRDLSECSLDYMIVLAQDAIYRADGTRDDDMSFLAPREVQKELPGWSLPMSLL